MPTRRRCLPWPDHAGSMLPGHIHGVVGKHPKRRDAFPQYGGLDGSCRWAAQDAKVQIPGSVRGVRLRAIGRPRRIPGGALHIRDQLHLFPGKLGEGQADHYIFPPVPCPVIDARGDLDDRNSRWQNRQTAMLARTRPGPAGARGTPGRAMGWCAAIYTKPSYSPLDVALAASCILGHRIQLHPLDALRGATSV